MSNDWQIDNLPDWFQFRVGFTWLDDDGDVCVLLGWEPEACVHTGGLSVNVNGVSTVGVTYDYQQRMTMATWHKNTWCMGDLRDSSITAHADKWQRMPADHAHSKALMTRATNKHQRY